MIAGTLTMSIIVPCSCGKKLRIKDQLAGKRIKCPGCGTALSAPAVMNEEPEAPSHELAGTGAKAKDACKHEGEPFFWGDPNAVGGQIIALSDDCLYMAELDEKEFKRAQAALGKRAPVGEVLDEAKVIIPFDLMHQVQSNLHHRFIDVTWQGRKEKEKTETNLLCADQDARDAILDALQGRLGWRRQVVEYTRLRAVWPPLVLIVLMGFITLCGVLAASHPETDGGTKVVRTNWLGAIFAWTFNFFGPVGMALLGTPFMLGGVIWLVMRLINPPLMLTLTPRPGPRANKRSSR